MTKEERPAGQGGAPSASVSRAIDAPKTKDDHNPSNKVSQLSPIQRARAEGVAQCLRGEGPGSLFAPLDLNDRCYEEIREWGLGRRDVDRALNYLADASIVTLRCKSGVVVADLVRQQK